MFRNLRKDFGTVPFSFNVNMFMQIMETFTFDDVLTYKAGDEQLEMLQSLVFNFKVLFLT